LIYDRHSRSITSELRISAVAKRTFADPGVAVELSPSFCGPRFGAFLRKSKDFKRFTKTAERMRQTGFRLVMQRAEVLNDSGLIIADAELALIAQIKVL